MRIQLGPHACGGGAPLVLIAGPCVIESEEQCVAHARRVRALADRHGVATLFKASFDKANRTSERGFRGPGLEAGLRALAAAKRETGLAVLTDVHEPAQCPRVAEVADVLQIPAFLCRQTDLIHAAADTGRAVNIKKGQFMAPKDMAHAAEKVRARGNANVMLTERGATFGYGQLVVDMRALVVMRAFAPVCFDATHSVQLPGAGDGATGGERAFVAPLARAAAAAGIDALFCEVYEDPDRARSDGANALNFDMLDKTLGEVLAVQKAIAG